MTDNLITLSQAADRLGVSRARLTKLIHQDRVPQARKVGNRWLIELDEGQHLPTIMRARGGGHHRIPDEAFQ